MLWDSVVRWGWCQYPFDIMEKGNHASFIRIYNIFKLEHEQYTTVQRLEMPIRSL